MDDKYDLIYNTPHLVCRCRDKYNKLTPIARIYKTYYDKLVEGKTSIEALVEMGITKMCCRERFLCIPIEHMINRSKDRHYEDNDRELITKDTRILEPLIQPPNFPSLPL